jgi:hypothetical protein
MLAKLLSGCSFAVFALTLVSAQSKPSLSRSTSSKVDHKQTIHRIMDSFMKCIHKKDEATYYSLFAEGPISWYGVMKDESDRQIKKKNPKAKSWFSDSPKEFYDSLRDEDKNEERFDNITIIEDGSIASVTFDYSFWRKGKMLNWGTEHWGMVRIDGKWKISSVVFSMDMTEYAKQPTLKHRAAEKRKSLERQPKA